MNAATQSPTETIVSPVDVAPVPTVPSAPAVVVAEDVTPAPTIVTEPSVTPVINVPVIPVVPTPAPTKKPKKKLLGLFNKGE